jgi:undecaprenyl-phosphate 4-deoxy-4-formamido-L-arabinose transferase
MNEISSSSIALSYVIPLYRCQESVGRLIERLSNLRISERWEVIFVDDSSPDNTYAIIKKLLEKTSINATLVRHTRNFGEHQAVITGYRYSQGEYVVNIDDDLQNPPEEAIELWEKARGENLDAVYADFFQSKKHSLWRNLGSLFANKTAHFLLDLPEDIHLASFRCLSRTIIDLIKECSSPYIYIDGLVSQYTDRIGTIRVRHDPRQTGASNYNMKRLVRLWLIIFTGFSVAPLRIASVVGIAVVGLGIAGLLFVLIEALIIGAVVPGWVSLMCVLLFLGGLQCFMLGIIGEYIGRIFLTISGKPQSAVRTVERFHMIHD